MTDRRPVEFTLSSERDLRSIYDYVSAQTSDDVADAYVARIVAQCQSLGDFPIRGQLRDDILPGLRVLGFERRVTIAFVFMDEAVIIEGVFYGGRDFQTAMRR